MLERDNKNPRNDNLDALIQNIKSSQVKDYAEHRLKPQMDWYGQKSRKHKKIYYFWFSLTILLGSIIPLLSVYVTINPDFNESLPFYSALLASAVTTINAFLSLGNSKELWITYRSVRETLWRTLCFYLTGTGNFTDKTRAQRDALFIELCEAEMAHENGTWRSMNETSAPTPAEGQTSLTDANETAASNDEQPSAPETETKTQETPPSKSAMNAKGKK